MASEVYRAFDELKRWHIAFSHGTENSKPTAFVRSDLAALASRGLVVRTHGGAASA